ncbi:levanbiose-producing levanase [Terribacillus saccharophilus]|uniref:Levanbiose-producing levanase n=1 Tax=Terribacillus saccharophilus TaxID=361277 RepID=A0AAX2EGQ8_9BACI|nr:glycoside hydrolase family 32 protein [Terribacillus saccharophilus]MEC0291612.1 glycoside hydrolase family 32 protein [Terribacillus saccharophilus]SEN47951.1 levanbiose-producing levanase [Terribacillus saccharophilus]
MLGGVILLVVAVIAVSVLMNEKKTEKQNPGKAQTISYRPDFHFSSPDKWKNDPQQPIYYQGKYHYYYLYNKDYPEGNGTEWRHATSEDLIHWEDHGVAIPKYTTENGDPWTGSVVHDKNNTAGFGEDALIAIVTQPTGKSGRQEQYLWYSTDGGNTFKQESEEPVLANPGTEDFRDPKVIWNDEKNNWIMLLAEGDKIGFYESADLKTWTFTGDFQTDGIGVLECPDLFQLRAPDGAVKYVLGMSANGEGKGEPKTYAYWTGDFDGTTFTPDEENPKWLDYGFDWYGGVTFEDGLSEDEQAKRYALAWMNNWSYADQTPSMKYDGFNGTDSIVREITLQQEGDGYYLASQPIAELDQLFQSADTVENIELQNETKALDISAETYRLDADISWTESPNVGLRLRESKDHSRHLDVGIAAADGYSYVNRSHISNPDQEGVYQESKAPFDTEKKLAHLTILVDKTSVEVFVNDGEVVHSNVVFPHPQDQAISIFAEGGSAKFDNISIKRLSETQ